MNIHWRMIRSLWQLTLFVALASGPSALQAQGSHRDLDQSEANVIVEPSLFEGLKYRSLEFSRGGRSTAVAGVPSEPLVYYFGASGGGVWRTEDGGVTWENVSDGFLGVGSIGAIAVADSDPNVVYVGTGSACPRGNVSVGDGIYKSTDAGKTWKHMGLRQAGQIAKIRVHPDNPDLVYAAALGHIFGPNQERGIFRSKDGGETWEKVLYISERVGFFGLAMDVTNPRILYAAAWRAERKPWSLISGTEEGGIFKTTDGGDNWDKLEGGLPTGMLGKIDVTVSPASPDRVWALIEAEGERGGVYRSDDAGKTWKRINGDAKLRQRPWYYIHIYADPKDKDTVYALNTGFYKSVDGGKTFDTRITVPHGDNHDLWINPNDPQNMINSNDGGANVSFNGGASWSWQMNQRTAEIYRLFVDDQWPYRVYGSQQDNSTISVPSRGSVAWNRLPPEWYAVGGCESGHIAIDPRNPDIIYAGCYGGSISWINRGTREFRQILAYPQLQLGSAPRDLKYRFQWNAPIRLSPHDPDILYHSAQIVLRSKDHGQSWEEISPDLTTNNPEHQDYAGGPITHDSTGVEVYNTVFAFEESPHQPGLLWAGSDDGKVHISRDYGANWKDITPKKMPEGGTVNVIELSAHDPGRAFIAVYRYREDDFHPYIFRTNNYGESWDLLTNGTNGIPATHFTRAIREDPDRKGLLYVGTEFGLYISFDDGAHWQSLQLNLPVTPVTDLRVHRKDLVVSTQGRAFWVLDDVTPLHQITDQVKSADAWLYRPRVAYRGGPFGEARINYYFAKLPEDEVTLEILDSGGKVIRTVKGKPGEEVEEGPADLLARFFGGDGPKKLPVKEGLNTFTWNLRHEALKMPKGVIHWGGAPGMWAVPGSYDVRLTSGDWSQTQPLKVDISPNLSTTVAQFQEQHDLAAKIADGIEALFDGLTNLRDIKAQTKSIVDRMKKAGFEEGRVAEAAKGINEKLTPIEEQITQVKSKSRQDPINFPPMLDNQLTTLYSYVIGSDYEPTAGGHQRFEDLESQVTDLLSQLQEVIDTDLGAFNDLVRSLNVPPVVIGKGKRPTTE
ncbi:MAG: glycosyl hydrolase [Acidobacteriota bacterium]